MEVTTNTVLLTKKRYFNILLSLYIRRRWWLFAFITIMMALQFLPNAKSEPFLIIFSILLPVLVLFQLWRFTNSDENRNFFKAHYHIITSSTLRTYLEDGSESTVQLSAFVKAQSINNVYLLYLSKSQCILIPETAFKSDDERAWFHRNIFNSLK